jgi:hypothetical protein
MYGAQMNAAHDAQMYAAQMNASHINNAQMYAA